MLLYHYAKEDGRLVGTTEARRDPLDKDRFLVPAYCTELPPPDSPEGFLPLFASGAWSIQKDLRGRYFDKADGREINWENAANPPVNATEVAPPELTEGQTVRWEGDDWIVESDGLDVERWFAAEIAKGFTSSTGITLGLGGSDVSLLTGNFVLAKEADSLGMALPPVFDTSGTAHALTMEELTALMLEYGQHRAELSAEFARRKAEA